MDLAADLAEQPFDRRMDVLVIGLDPTPGGDLRESTLRLRELGIVQDPGRMQPARVDRSRLAVVRQQLRVVGAQKRRHGGIELAPDPPGPQAHRTSFVL